MKTMTKKEFYDELERERKSAVRVFTIGFIACVVLIDDGFCVLVDSILINK